MSARRGRLARVAANQPRQPKPSKNRKRQIPSPFTAEGYDERAPPTNN